MSLVVRIWNPELFYILARGPSSFFNLTEHGWHRQQHRLGSGQGRTCSEYGPRVHPRVRAHGLESRMVRRWSSDCSNGSGSSSGSPMPKASTRGRERARGGARGRSGEWRGNDEGALVLLHDGSRVQRGSRGSWARVHNGGA